MNATVTVTYNGQSVTFDLDDTELSEVPGANGSHRYLSNASRGFVADEVEKALLTLVPA